MTQKIKLFCILDGDSSAFEVQLDADDSIAALKDAIKKKNEPQFDDIAAGKLNLFHVSVPDEGATINLANIESKELLTRATSKISKIFGISPLPEETINVIIQRPLEVTNRLSEAEFVQHVLSNITGTDQTLRSKTKTSTRRVYSITPASVRDWNDFLPLVRRMPLATEPQYTRPSFSLVRTFTTESDLQGIFRYDVGSVRGLPPFTDTRGSFRLTYGTPDLVCSREDNRLALFPIEMKRPVKLHLNDDTSYSVAYLAQGSSSQGPVGPLKQIFGYIRLNGFRYGVLSTYTQTWFIKRDSAHGDGILISPTIHFDRTNPTLLQCYLWLIRTVDSDTEWQPDIPDETSVEYMLSKEQPEDKATKRDSDFVPERGGGGKWKQGFRAYLTRSKTKKQATGSMQLERRTVPAFKDMRLITFGEGARTFRATWMGEDVVVKKADIWKQSPIVDELEHEATIYEELQMLQGHFVPELKLAGIMDGMEMVLVTEFTGSDLCNKHLDASDRDKIRGALSAIHDLGVLHGDIRPDNITARLDGQDSRFFFIDFGCSKFAKHNSALDREMGELEALLELMPWPEDYRVGNGGVMTIGVNGTSKCE